MPFKNKNKVKEYLVPILEHYEFVLLLKGNHDDFIDGIWVKDYADKTSLFDRSPEILLEERGGKQFILPWQIQLAFVHNGKKIVAGHHPLEDFRGYDYHFHGHWHGRGLLENKLVPNRFDVGVDTAYILTGRYRPLTTQEVIDFTEQQNKTLLA